MLKYKIKGERRLHKKALLLVSLCILSLAAFSPIVSAQPVTIPNQEHYIYESIGDPETVDSAWSYDTASGLLIQNVYDTLIFFDHESVTDYIPSLATDWAIDQPPHPDAPAGTDSTWYFTIRTNVPWQDPAYGTLTPADVEHSFERAMVQDRSGGPVWMFNEPLIGDGWPDKSGWVEAAGNPIDTAVESDGTQVWFNLAMPYPPFMQILSQTWASILSQAWCTDQGDWDGDWSNWKAYEDPEMSPLDAAGSVMMGTGAYALDYWTHGVEWSIVRHANYWGDWPAPHCSRYLDRFTEKVVYEWGTRYADFIGGYADTVYVPRAYLPQMILNWPTEWDPDRKLRYDAEGNPEYYAEGIRALPGIPTLQEANFFFNFDTNPATGYTGSGSFPDGIPLDFFSDLRIRQAFAYSFDYQEFLDTMFWGEAVQPRSCVPAGTPYQNPDNPVYSLNYEMARDLFQAASADPTSPAYGVWTSGFEMTITYNTGNIPRETTTEMLRDGVQAVFSTYGGGPVSISVLGVPWPTYLGELVGYPLFRSLMPIFVIGWLADFPDAHNWVVPYMHSAGDFSGFQSYGNATIDALIAEGISTPDGPAREAIYYELQQIYYDDCPSIGTSQAYGRRWQRDWVQGWYWNTIVPQGGGGIAYTLWKGLTGDITGDNIVDIFDVIEVSSHYYNIIEIPFPPYYVIIEGVDGYDRIADIVPILQYPLEGLVTSEEKTLINAHMFEEVA